MITVTVCCVNVISLHSTTSNWAGQPLNGDWQHFSADQGGFSRYLMQVDQDQVRSFLGLTVKYRWGVINRNQLEKLESARSA